MNANTSSNSHRFNDNDHTNSPLPRRLRQMVLATLAVCGLALPTVWPTPFASAEDDVAAHTDDSGSSAPSKQNSRGKPPLSGVVNINTATLDELCRLPGIGPARAAAIIELRKKHPFRTPEEIVRVKGIGRKMLKKMRTNLTTSGPTTIGGS